jgi:hypothetical protein
MNTVSQAELRQSDRRSKLFSIKQSKAASMVPPSFSKVSSQTKYMFKDIYSPLSIADTVKSSTYTSIKGWERRALEIKKSQSIDVCSPNERNVELNHSSPSLSSFFGVRLAAFSQFLKQRKRETYSRLCRKL